MKRPGLSLVCRFNARSCRLFKRGARVNRKRHYRCPLCSIGFSVQFLIAVLSAAFVAEGQAAVVVDGNVIEQVFEKSGSVQSDYTNSFEAVGDGRGWMVRVDYGRNHYVETVGYEGTDTFSLRKFSRSATVPPEGGPPDLYLPSGYIFPGSYPYMSEPTTRYVWIAYGSAAFLSTNQTYLPPLWTMGFGDPAQLGMVVSHCDLMAGGLPRLVRWEQDPTAIDAYAGSLYLNPQVTASAITKARKQLTQEVRAGVIYSAEYKATTTTNIAGLTVPTAFEFRLHMTQHLPGGRGMDYDWLLVRGTVSHLAQRSGLRFVPSIAGDITVRDYRFRTHRVDQIYYKDTNQVWLGTNEPQLQKAFVIAIASHPPPLHTRAYGLWVALLCLVVLVSPIFILRLWKRRSAR